jgi:DNA (cytosine-5)-methyltransferase 1
MRVNVLDLFSGIGGFSLGLERAGMRTVAFCEIDPFARRVLAKHWPDVPCYDDVRSLTAKRLAADGIAAVDVICGGFPCQDISFAGKGAGLAGERSGLWSEYARIIGEFRPRFVIVENVAALLSRGLDAVLGDLASLGYDAEWHCIPASAIGAPHRRDRVWILAYRQADAFCADTNGTGSHRANQHLIRGTELRDEQVRQFGPLGQDVADAAGERRGEARGLRRNEPAQRTAGSGQDVPDANQVDAQGLVSQRNDTLIRREQIERQARLCSGAGDYHDWSIEPAVGRVAHGVPDRVGQLRAYGNAVVPQIPEIIGRAIMRASA